MYGTAGIPDIVACIGGRFYAFEVKQPKGRLTDLQKVMIRKIRAAGGVAATVSDMPHSGSRDVQSMEGIIVKIIDLENEMYLCFFSWEKVAVEMDYDLRYLHKLHRKALEKCAAFIPAGV